MSVQALWAKLPSFNLNLDIANRLSGTTRAQRVAAGALAAGALLGTAVAVGQRYFKAESKQTADQTIEDSAVVNADDKPAVTTTEEETVELAAPVRTEEESTTADGNNDVDMEVPVATTNANDVDVETEEPAATTNANDDTEEAEVRETTATETAEPVVQLSTFARVKNAVSEFAVSAFAQLKAGANFVARKGQEFGSAIYEKGAHIAAKGRELASWAWSYVPSMPKWS